MSLDHLTPPGQETAVIERRGLRRPSRVRVVDDVFHSLREAILSGRVRPGERLVETTIAAELDVSRGTVREALLMLAQDHLVVIRPRRGTVVTRIEPADARDIKMNRALLESFAVGIGGDRLDEELLRGLEARLVAMRACSLPNDLPVILEFDLDFHRLLVCVADSARLLSLWSSLNGQIGALMLSSIERKHLQASDLVRLHQALIDTVRTGDPRAIQQAIVEHYIAPEELDAAGETMRQATTSVAAYAEQRAENAHHSQVIEDGPDRLAEQP